MTVTFSGKPAAGPGSAATVQRKRPNGHTMPKRPAVSLDQPGRVRVAHFQWYLGEISASAFYQRLKKGRVPPPCGNDGRPYWRTEVVKEFLEK